MGTNEHNWRRSDEFARRRGYRRSERASLAEGATFAQPAKFYPSIVPSRISRKAISISNLHFSSCQNSTLPRGASSVPATLDPDSLSNFRV